MYERIRSGAWAADTKIPTESQLAKEFAISRGTIRKALKHLEDMGLLKAERGSGRVVTRKAERINAPTRNTIGVVLNKFQFDIYGDMEAIQNAASERGFDINIYVTNKKTSPLGRISVKDVRGLLTYCQEVGAHDIVEFNKYFPTVSILHNCAFANVPSYYLSWDLVTFDIASFLMGTGFSDVLLIAPCEPSWDYWHNHMVAGLKYAYHKHGVHFDQEECIIRLPFSYKRHDVECLAENLARRIEAKGKLACVSTITWAFLEMMNWAANKGVAIPDTLSAVAVVDLNDPVLWPNVPKPVSAYCFNLRKVAADATNHLLDMLDEEPPTKPLDNLILGELVQGSTTLKPKNCP